MPVAPSGWNGSPMSWAFPRRFARRGLSRGNDHCRSLCRLSEGQSMQLVKVAAAALNQTPLAWDENQRNILAALADARAAGATLVCLPELCITGYGCEDAFHSRGVQREALEMLEALVPQTRGLVVCIGVPLL